MTMWPAVTGIRKSVTSQRVPDNSGMPDLINVHTDEQIQQVAGLAHSIWNEHFPKIIGQAQVDYMVERFQSSDAIRNQIRDGYQYYLIRSGTAVTGYTALISQPDRRCLQISKLYLLQAWRGKGFARAVLGRITGIATDQGFEKLYLTVNKYNHSALAAYHKLGFTRKGELVADIGNGFVMDDYEMELVISRHIDN